MDRFKNSCRICIKEDGIKIPIFGEEGHYRGVVAKIKECLNILLHPNDPLPKNICNTCFYKLELAAELKETYQRSNDIFIQHLSTQRGNTAVREYLNREHSQQMPPPQQVQKRKLPNSSNSHQDENESEPQRKRPALERQPNLPKSRSAVPNRLTVLPRSDVLSRTRSSGVSPQLPSTSSSLFETETYSCRICDKTSTSKKTIRVHENRDHTNEEFVAVGRSLDYVCNICERRFETVKSLRMHSTKYHKIRLSDISPSPSPSCDSPCPTNSLLGIKVETAEDVSYECSICYLICSDENDLHEHFTLNHKQISSPSPTNEDLKDTEDLPATKPECIFCFQTFKNNSGLVCHLRTAHGKPSCIVCLEIFSIQEELLSHRSIHRNMITTPKKTNNEVTPTENEVLEDENNSNFECDKCGKVFDRQISYARHKASHTRRGPSWVPQDILAAKESISQSNASSKHNNTPNSQMSDTSNSGKSFVRVSGSKISVRKLKSNNSNIPYCLYCKKILESYKDLWDHIIKMHPNCPRYKCPHINCGRIFFGKPGYRSHLSTHKDDVTSNVVTNGNTDLQSNESKSSIEPESPQCFSCLKTFHNWNNMRRHFMEQHKHEKYYECPDCKKIYGTQRELDDHINDCHSKKETRQKTVQPHLPKEKYLYNKKLVGGKTKIYAYPKVLCRYCPKYLSKKYVTEHEKLHRKAGLKPLGKIASTNVSTSKENYTKEENVDSDDNEEGDEKKKGKKAVNGMVSKETGFKGIMKKKKKALCKYCKNIFDSFKLLELHLKSKHNGKSYFKCSLCPQIYFDTVALKSHSNCHNRSYKKCSYCDRTFAYHNYLKVHEKMCSKQKKMVKKDKNEDGCDGDINPPPVAPAAKPVAKPAAKSSDVSTPIYTCDFCGAQFLETQLFVKHLQGHANAM